MSFHDKIPFILKTLKVSSVLGSTGFIAAYYVNKTLKSIRAITNPNVLEAEKKQTPEYIYIHDPSYNDTLKIERDKENEQSVGIARIWKSLKHSLAWRLLWLCRHGNHKQRNMALERLASFKRNKDWDCLKIAQAMDKTTAVLLARTRGADYRYFLPPPLHVRKEATSNEILSFKLKDIILTIEQINPHSCIKHFLSKYFSNVQEQAMEADHIPSKPAQISERNLCLLCLDAIHHHISLFHTKDYCEDISINTLVKMGLIPKLAEVLLRYQGDIDIDLAVLKIITVLSVHCSLLTDIFQNGLIRELARLITSDDVRLSSSAAVCLANLSGEQCYRPGLYLLHPIYRTTIPQTCDICLVHGLRGGVFVTWRQRDKKCVEPLSLLESTVTDVDCEPCEKEKDVKYIDPELQQVMDELVELEEHTLLSDLEVVLQDIPIKAKRESLNLQVYTAPKKRNALIQEGQDQCNYTFCWPKDWLPRDCKNLRILGVNYWSTLSEWLERCPLQTADISVRAAEFAPALIDASVGKNVPLVWLAHSMGGLIVKQVLIESVESKNNDLKKLAENTKAILFYSTPHRGSALAAMPRAAAAILWPSNDVRQLQENSPVLLKLHKSFLKSAETYGWETISFAESKPTLVTAFKVPINFVEANSADVGRGLFYEMPLDHLSICKPASRQSLLYTTALDVIQRVSTEHMEMKYHNHIIEYLVELLLWAFKIRKPKDMIEVIDETHNDGFGWFEKFLLETFTDGFTD